MGKALLVAGADFSAVAVEKITITPTIPCTGIVLDTETISVTGVNDTVSITATLTPSNTTDTPTWSSSNDSVASVDAHGVVTVHGIGTATITATCGDVSATATVNQTSLTVTPLEWVAGKYVSPVSSELPAAYIFSHNALNLIAAPYTNDSKSRLVHGDEVNCQAIAAPYGATSARLHTNNGSRIYGNVILLDCQNLTAYNGVDYATYISMSNAYITDAFTLEYGKGVVYRLESDKSAVIDSVIFE